MVLQAAQSMDKARVAGRPLGILHGLPIPVKDSVNTKDFPTSNGTRALRDFKAKDDAAVLKPLLSQGAIVMGKTNLHELSYGWTSNNATFGSVRNPYDTQRVPGGSSGAPRAGAYAYGRSTHRIRLEQGRKRIVRGLRQKSGKLVSVNPRPS
jgi:mandelamide amidase